MGIFNRKKEGTVCVPKEGNILLCSRVQEVDGQLMATGSSIPIMVDPNTCTATVAGEYRAMDDDKEWVAGLVKSAEQSCRKGIA